MAKIIKRIKEGEVVPDNAKYIYTEKVSDHDNAIKTYSWDWGIFTDTRYRLSL